MCFLSRRLYETIFHSRNLLFRINLADFTHKDKFLNASVKVLDRNSFQDLSTKDKETLKNYGGYKLIAVFRKRLAAGHRLFVAYLNGELAGASWVYIGGKRRFFKIPLSKRDILVLDTFTIDKFRRLGVSTKLNIDILKIMKQKGFQQAFVFTKEWNFHQKTIMKAGYEFVGKFYAFKFLRRNILIWSSVIDEDFL